MKHLKPYHIFESQEIIDAAVWNAINKKNLELFKGLCEQHSDLIDYKKVVGIIIENHMDVCFPFLRYVPSKYLDHIKELDYNKMNMSSMDVSMFYNLERLYCANNHLTELDVSNNTKLKTLKCQNNNLTELDLNSLPQLRDFSYDYNRTKLIR